MQEGVLPYRYVALPPWFYRCEVPYGFSPVTAVIVTYRDDKLKQDVWSPLLSIFLVEWFCNCARALLYEAQSGKLWWLPSDAREGIRTLGLFTVLNAIHSVPLLDQLLREVELIHWEAVDGRNRLVSMSSNGFTLVYGSGDLAPIQAEAWKTNLTPDLYVAEDPERPGYSVGGRWGEVDK